VVVAGALITAALVTPLAMWVAQRTGLVDHPGPLKVHARPVPYLGGVGIGAALAWGVIATRPSLLLPFGAALALGILDDARSISPLSRLIGEIAIGASIGVLLPVGDPRVVGVLFSIVATVVLCNGINMVDGLDGLAGGTAFVAAAGFYVVLVGGGATIAIALAAGLAAFLAFNLPPAGVYLGDGGAYLVGTALATLFVIGSQPYSGASFGAAALLVGYPLVELVFSVVRRGVQRTSPLHGDRDHLYDQLHTRGLSPSLASLACVGLATVLVAVGVTVAGRSPTSGLVAAFGCGMMILTAGALTGFLVPRPRRP
jgi:UDP-GlcNAc:undecaprenyl-phosphate GlcNAc-1-phosphate transferase